MIQTRFSQMMGIARPIVQGGLASLAFAPLAAAVSNAGGLGQITAASFATADDLRQEIALAQSLTDKPFAVNYAVGHRTMFDLLDVALEMGVAAVSFTAGNPEPYIKHIQHNGYADRVKVLVLVAGTRAAQKAEGLGAHAVIAVGYEGGGHLGRDDIGTSVLVPRIVDAVKIPVLASGGIGDGRGYAAALCWGAEGIEMGTRFVATQECIAHANYKNALVAAKETDSMIIERGIGRPGRALRGTVAEKIVQIETATPTLEVLLPYINGEINRLAAVEGALDDGYVWMGQVAGLIHDIPTVAELLTRMTEEAEAILTRLTAQIGQK